MGFEHWIMQNFWLVMIISLIVLLAGHFAVVWLMQQGKKPEETTASQAKNDERY
jgi:flagellar basal body-associated protein FliL